MVKLSVSIPIQYFEAIKIWISFSFLTRNQMHRQV